MLFSCNALGKHWPGCVNVCHPFHCQTKCSYPSICQQKGSAWRVLGGWGGAHKRLHVSLGDSFSTGLINCAASALRTNAAPSCQNRENLLNPVLNLPWFFCNALCSTQISDKWMECAAFCSGLWSMVKKSQQLPAAEKLSRYSRC